MPSPIPSHVGILGGGTASYFAALALRKHFPDLRITLIESSKIPIIGVGEATTPPLVAFLHDFQSDRYPRAVSRGDADVEDRHSLRLGLSWRLQLPFSTGELTEAHAYDGYIDCALAGIDADGCQARADVS